MDTNTDQTFRTSTLAPVLVGACRMKPRVSDVHVAGVMPDRVCVSCRVDYGADNGGSFRLAFIGVAGAHDAPVVMVSESGHQTFVYEPSRYGAFNAGWVSRFFA